MKNQKNVFFAREEDKADLIRFVARPGSQFMYMRGRRRVGKSWLLKNFAKKNKNTFYYTGAPDASHPALLTDFASSWDLFSKTSHLSEIRSELLNWKRIFDEISRYIRTSRKPTVLIFDEIQWIAKTGSGFVGKLKEAWQDWEPLRKAKVIICGSSNKFFSQYVGSEEKVLRGLTTRASLFVEPFTLGETKKYYFPNWSREELALLYMMLGGIPYYLSQLKPDHGLIHTINQAIFTRETIFLEEVDEILNLEFNAKGRETVKKIMSTLGQAGTTHKIICQKTGLSPSTISETLEKLADYKLVFPELPYGTNPSRHKAGYRYAMRDFFLNFYFQILEPLEKRIRSNTQGLLFPYACIDSKNSFYIPNFSGKAFELLIRSLLEKRKGFKTGLFEKLLLRDENFEVGTYWNNQTQIDLVVEHKKDDFLRIIECKWLSTLLNNNFSELIDEVAHKSIQSDKKLKHFLILSQEVSAAQIQKAREKNVTLITLQDLF